MKEMGWFIPRNREYLSSWSPSSSAISVMLKISLQNKFILSSKPCQKSPLERLASNFLHILRGQTLFKPDSSSVKFLSQNSRSSLDMMYFYLLTFHNAFLMTKIHSSCIIFFVTIQC